jgi:NTE family protein
LGLALGCGGWRALAHLGVIKELLKKRYQISYIAGSSAGALVGGMYSAIWRY